MVRVLLKVTVSPFSRVMTPEPSSLTLMADTASSLLAKFSMVPFSMTVDTGSVSTTSMSWRAVRWPSW